MLTTVHGGTQSQCDRSVSRLSCSESNITTENRLCLLESHSLPTRPHSASAAVPNSSLSSRRPALSVAVETPSSIRSVNCGRASPFGESDRISSSGGSPKSQNSSSPSSSSSFSSSSPFVSGVSSSPSSTSVSLPSTPSERSNQPDNPFFETMNFPSSASSSTSAPRRRSNIIPVDSYAKWDYLRLDESVHKLNSAQGTQSNAFPKLRSSSPQRLQGEKSLDSFKPSGQVDRMHSFPKFRATGISVDLASTGQFHRRRIVAVEGMDPFGTTYLEQSMVSNVHPFLARKSFTKQTWGKGYPDTAKMQRYLNPEDIMDHQNIVNSYRTIASDVAKKNPEVSLTVAPRPASSLGYFSRPGSRGSIRSATPSTTASRQHSNSTLHSRESHDARRGVHGLLPSSNSSLDNPDVVRYEINEFERRVSRYEKRRINSRANSPGHEQI